MDYKNWDVGEIFFICLKLLGVVLITGLIAHFLAIRLPKDDQILPISLEEPQQEATTAAPFRTFVEALDYQIFPKAEYRIRGLVVSLHDSAFMDITHAAASDFVNTHDICVIWGDNARSPYLKEMDFSHGDWTCYFQTKSQDAWKSFNKNQISNNHILPANPQIEKIIASIRIGDQIELAGKLVDYSLPSGGTRKTSLVRDDVENGACEILYVSEANILKRGSNFWHSIQVACKIAGALLLLTIAFSIFILPKLQRA